MRKEYWIQKVKPEHGALHRELGIPLKSKIPVKLLKEVKNAEVGEKVKGKTVTKLMKKRANFALNVR